VRCKKEETRQNVYVSQQKRDPDASHQHKFCLFFPFFLPVSAFYCYASDKFTSRERVNIIGINIFELDSRILSYSLGPVTRYVSGTEKNTII
jgi:hypothetical protein